MLETGIAAVDLVPETVVDTGPFAADYSGTAGGVVVNFGRKD